MEAEKVLEMFLHKQCNLQRTQFAYSQNEVFEAVTMASKALEKQIPKKPEESYDGYADGNPVIDYHCPNCYREVDEDELEHHCECGQALDWSDTK